MKSKTTTLANTLLSVIIFALISFTTTSCNKDNSVQPNQTELNDTQYIQSVVAGGYNSGNSVEDNLMTQETSDFDDGGAVKDNDNGPDSNIDSLLRWGRKVENVNINYNITSSGDTMFTVNVTRTITGKYIIIGYVSGLVDSINKPYTEVFYRTVIFKRVDSTQHPRLNWRVYQISNLDGGTTTPQIGSSQVQITKIEVYGSLGLLYTFNGPDFQNQLYTTMRFGGQGIPAFARGEQLTYKVYTTSQLSPTDYVAFHWARNTYGFHRIPFTLESQTGTGPYYRVYTKSFTIYDNHKFGFFNAYLSASTHESLYDSDPNKFASDEVSFPYKIFQ